MKVPSSSVPVNADDHKLMNHVLFISEIFYYEKNQSW